MEATVERGSGWDLRLGRWQDVLADVMPDALITDVPYGERTINGQRSGTVGYKIGPRANIPYAFLSAEDTEAFAADMMQRKSLRWVAAFCDHTQWFTFERVLKDANMMTFQPIPWVKSCGGTPRFTADGPSSSSEWLMVARQRKRCITRYRPGHYAAPAVRSQHNHGVTGAKPLDLMRAIVRDYSEPGDLVCDPFAGSGTTLLAAVTEGRRAIGAEMDEGRFEIAVRRLRGGYTPPLFSGADGEGL